MVAPQTPTAYAMRGVRLPDETLADVKAEWDRLSSAEKADLVDAARVEMDLLGVPCR